MLVVKAKVFIDKEITGNANFIISGFKVTTKIGNKGFITQILDEKGDRIQLCKENEVILCILYGEIAIMDILKGAELEFVTSKIVGKAQIIEFKEVYVEKEAIECIDDMNSRKELVLWAENAENTLIEEGVYELLF